jgi:hypothetical protein
MPLTRSQRASSIFWAIISVLFGWTLFVFWWSRVLSTDQPRALTDLLLWIALFCALTTFAALWWIRHNRRLARRGRRGMATRYRVPTFLMDALGRAIVLPAGGGERHADVVVIDSSSTKKIYAAEADATV